MDSQFQHEAERDGLVDAATTDERAEVVEVVEITTGAVGAKRKKATRIESLQNKVAAATEKIEKKQKLVATAVSKQSLRAKEKESLQRWETELNNLFNERRAAQESLQVLLDAREQQDTTKAAKAIEQLERAERANSRHMSEAGVNRLINMRMSMERRFNNTKETVANLWAELAENFNKLVDNNELPETDRRSAQQLHNRYDDELGEFRRWCQVADKAVKLSGVSADEVEEKVEAHRRPSTRIFMSHGYWKRPMSISPWTVSGATALTGGSGPSFVPSAALRAGEEEEEEFPPMEGREKQQGQVDGDDSDNNDVEDGDLLSRTRAGGAGGSSSAATTSYIKNNAGAQQQQAEKKTGQATANKEEKGKGRRVDTASADAMRQFATVFKESHAEQRQLLRDIADEQRRREDRRLQHEEALASKYCRQQ